MAKKSIKAVSAMALCLVMLIMSVVPAFAVTYVENHDIIDCTNRFKTNDGKFDFTIKIPKECSFSDVTIAITKNDNGDKYISGNMNYFSSKLTQLYTDGDSVYYQFLTDKYVAAGVGIKLYCNKNGSYYRATDTAYYSSTEGRGYWLSA